MKNVVVLLPLLALLGSGCTPTSPAMDRGTASPQPGTRGASQTGSATTSASVSSAKEYANTELKIKLSYPQEMSLKEYASGVEVIDQLPLSICAKIPELTIGNGECSNTFRIGKGEYPNGVEGALASKGITDRNEYKKVILPTIGEVYQRIGPRLEQGERSERMIEQQNILFARGESRKNTDGLFVQDVFEINIEWVRSIESEPEMKQSLEKIQGILRSLSIE